MVVTWSGRGDGEILKGVLSPLQKLEALVVPSELDFLILQKCAFDSADVGLDRVVNYQIDRNLGVDILGVLAESGHSVSHSGQIHHRGHSSEVLQHHSRRLERDLHVLLRSSLPVKDLLHVFRTDLELVAVTHRRLQQHSDREREFF